MRSAGGPGEGEHLVQASRSQASAAISHQIWFWA